MKEEILEETDKMDTKENENEKESEKKEKKNNEKVEKEKKNKKFNKKKYIIIAIIVLFLILVISTIFAFLNINNEEIISGVSIKGIAVSGLSKEEAKSKIETVYSEKKNKNIEIKYQEFESELNPTLMEVNYDIESAVNQAYELGRNNNIFVNNYNIVKTLVAKTDINVNFTLNEENTKKTIEDIGVNLPGVMTESSYSVEDDNLIITRGKEGIAIDSDKLLEEVKNELSNVEINDNVIEIPVKQKQPQEIDIDKIHSEIYKEAKDAYYTKDPFTIYPEVEGVDFNVETAKQLISSEQKDEYIIKLTITKPKVTISQIGTEAFPEQLATFTTRYDASDKDRTTNLTLACQKLNGKVVMAGETFSYNETLGQRSYAAGYRNAKVYENGQVVDGIGGGICQVSSTLYNAVLMSDLDIVERKNHQFVTSYVGAGRDATVVYGLTDFKFKNTRKYPIRITASAKSGIAIISIYGIKEADREFTYTFNTKTISTIPFTVKYVDDSTLTAGKEVVKQKGANGLVTETYMTKMLNGKIISTKLLSKDTYSAMQRIINKGNSATTNNTTNVEIKQEETKVETETKNETIQEENKAEESQETKNETE